MLPIGDGEEITLICEEGYTNHGGDKVICQNGAFAPTSTGLPDCRGESNCFLYQLWTSGNI